MAATPFIIVLHNHQPVGNFPWVTAECYTTAYEPFLTVLERHPRIRMGLHFTGPLLEWLQAERPDYLARVRTLVAAGQVEVLGGGLYEPILPVIPERDRRGQLRLLGQWVTELFGCAPTGAWLAERVWEPSLPPSLQASGVDYVLLDDEVFHRLGYMPQQTCATFLTEEDGAMVRVLPISRQLRYTIPVKPIHEVMTTLRAMRDAKAEVIIYAEDGERFGNWPGTQSFLYGKENYLEQLLTEIAATDELECVLPGEYVRAHAPSERVYLPPTSYQEMLEWSGGFWRNFLTRYRESNLMHKKMYQVSRWVAHAEGAGHDVAIPQRELYAAQCNCAYWYGAFGGLYLPHLRRAVYHHLLRAEAAVAPLLPRDARPAVQVSDHDCDGRAEIFLRDDLLSIGITPAQGGAVFALEMLAPAHNFLNTMCRYPLRAEEDSADLPVDWHPRFAFLDHFLSAETTVADMQQSAFGEQGDFVLGEYFWTPIDGCGVVLRRDGHIWDGPEFAPIRLEKSYRLAGNAVQVEYTLTNSSARERALRFAVEMNFQLSAGDAPGRQLKIITGKTAKHARLERAGDNTAADGIHLRDEWLGCEIHGEWSSPARTWTFPILTPLRSLEGLEWVYQSTVALPMWEITLAAGASWSTRITMHVAAIVPADTAALSATSIKR